MFAPSNALVSVKAMPFYSENAKAIELGTCLYAFKSDLLPINIATTLTSAFSLSSRIHRSIFSNDFSLVIS